MMFYLKYRPQKISELDLVEIREGLTQVLSAKSLPHAFLFAGPRGSGKTSAARIIAKVVNCSAGRSEPCNRCSMCKAITAGRALDLIEIDAASNRGIDDIRDLRQKIRLAPSEAQYKVYIIDEAHMLTKEAFNALLKTLEEPPKHAIFILCTTEPEKLPGTIISRCLRFNFRKGRPEEVVRSLQKVVRGEKLKAEKEVLFEISRHVDGSFRDAQKILEQLASGRKKITVEMVRNVVGQISECQPDVLLQYLVEKNVVSAIKEINKLVIKGANLKNYTQELLELLRQCLLQSVGVADRVRLCELNQKEIIRLIELFNQAGREVRTAIIPQLPLELAVIEWCSE